MGDLIPFLHETVQQHDPTTGPERVEDPHVVPARLEEATAQRLGPRRPKLIAPPSDELDERDRLLSVPSGETFEEGAQRALAAGRGMPLDRPRRRVSGHPSIITLELYESTCDWLRRARHQSEHCGGARVCDGGLTAY